MKVGNILEEHIGVFKPYTGKAKTKILYFHVISYVIASVKKLCYFALWSSEISFVFETSTMSVNSFKYNG